ncbi:MAG: RHS repeat-associated core domain-containing protein [Terracidiphilus sp.]|jgi:RHS repeat-associated protein
MKRIFFSLGIIVLLFASAQAGLSQQVAVLGTPAFGSFAGGPDVVNLGNLNVHWNFPIMNKAGRGLPFTYGIDYDSTIWARTTSGSTTSWVMQNTWPAFGANTPAIPGLGGITYTTVTHPTGGACVNPTNPRQPPVIWTGTIYQYSNFVFVDAQNTSHPFPGASATTISGGSSSCGPTNTASSNTYTSADGHQLTVAVSSLGNLSTSVTTNAGETTAPVAAVCNSTPVVNLVTSDMNGNQITPSVCGGVITDTLGTTVLTQTGSTAGGQVVLTGTNASGGPSQWTINYQSYSVQTNFGCSGISEYGPTTQYLPSELSLPDGRSYQFTYETTPGFPASVTGRIATVTLPTGGTISYTYSGGSNGINCTDGSPVTLTRTTPDGVTTYTRDTSNLNSANSMAGYAYTTITDPQGNQTKLTSAVDYYGPGHPNNYYEVARQIYSGNISAGALLETILTCFYNAQSSAPCTTTAPGTSSPGATYFTYWVQTGLRKTYQWPDSTGISNGTLDILSGVENVTSHTVYDYSAASSLPSTVLQTTNTVYAGGSNGVESTLPSEVTVLDPTGNVVADTQYTYSGDTMATTGTPQHGAPYYAPMNLTTVSKLISGSIASGPRLYSFTAYYDTGNVYQATDVNGNVTTYAYGDNAGSAAGCGNSFPTSVSSTTGGSVVTSLTTSATWNCTGGVMATSTDVNNNVTTYNYGSDPFWRPTSILDAAGNTTNYTYQTPSSNTTEVTMNFNGGASTNDVLTTYDGLGRAILTQKRQGPGASNFDSVATKFDNLGRAYYTSLPYSAPAGTYATSGPGVTTGFDALSRTSTVADAGGGMLTYGYSGNDVLVTNGPAPSGEIAKSRNLEYDGAGRLTSVCEVVKSTLPAGGACGQHAAYSGYLTKYAYDGASRLLSVTQDAQPGNQGVQTRTLTYDTLGRKLSETIPEWSAGTGVAGTATYVYDSDATGKCGGSFTGDLIKSTDNAGNVTCYTYDSLHRPLSSTVVSGAYASVTPSTFFVYDAANLYGTSMLNALGNIAEAYTGSSSAKITDLFFSQSISNGGTLSNVWESTPHSGGYWWTGDSYAANHALTSRSNSYGMPSVSYTLNGEGLPVTTTDNSYQLNLVTATWYNPAGSATGVTYGNGDSDAFGYDTSTNRPTSIVYNVTGGAPFTVTNALTWNANSSLQQMQLTDTNDPSKNQTCTYTADDLSRLASVNCGASTWAQTFAYDAFGNISKANGGNATSYPAGYSKLTNQVNSGLPSIPAYDSNGNQLSSTGLSSLSWNAAGQPWQVQDLSGHAYNGTYDALGRLVEIANGTTYTQFVFSPAGAKTAVVQGGTTLLKGLVGLPGGETAVYNGSGLNFIRHKDWLGSSRLATTWAHGIYSKEAYAPFGETYNEAGTPDRSFTGQDQDTVTGTPATGVYDYLFRKYDPAAGRWLSPDPKGWDATSQEYPQSLNRYAYVQNNPLSLTDPDGRDCVYSTDNGISIDHDPANIGQWCTASGGIYTNGGLQNSDISALYAGTISFYLAGNEDSDDYYDAIDAGEMSRVSEAQGLTGESSSHDSYMLSSMRMILAGGFQPGINGVYLDSYTFPDNQWFANGNIKPGFSSQDGICSSPMPGWMNNSPGMKSACDAHDSGYETYHCNASSWIPLLPGPCTMVNMMAIVDLVPQMIVSGIKRLF